MGVGIEGRAQNIAPLQVGGIVAVVAIDAIEAIVAIEAIEAIEAIVAIEDMGFWEMWAWWDGEDKKVGFAEKNCGCGGWRGLNVVRGKKLCEKNFLFEFFFIILWLI